MASYLNNGYDVMNCFTKFEKFLPHSILIPSFMSVGSQMPELDLGIFAPPPYKIGSQKTLYKLGLNMILKHQPGLGPQCPICAGMLLSITCWGKQTLVERNRKEQKAM